MEVPTPAQGKAMTGASSPPTSPRAEGAVLWRLSRKGAHLPPGTYCRAGKRLPFRRRGQFQCLLAHILIHSMSTVLHAGQCPAQTWQSQVDTESPTPTPKARAPEALKPIPAPCCPSHHQSGIGRKSESGLGALGASQSLKHPPGMQEYEVRILSLNIYR